MQQLIFLGTGAALATRCYNTCFLLKTPETTLLTDAGGGNGILAQFEKLQIPTESVTELFITHAHTDHFMGAVWMLRIAMQKLLKGTRTLPLHVYSHDKVLSLLDLISRMTLPERFTQLLGDKIIFHNIHDAETFRIKDIDLTCFDIHSTKERQFGYRATLPDNRHLVCLGDEPFNPVNITMAENADWLLCEAFCLEKDKAVYKPYEKHHGTVMAAAEAAERLCARNLVLYHTIDADLPQRKQLFTQEASRHFKGPVYVPDDLETIKISQ